MKNAKGKAASAILTGLKEKGITHAGYASKRNIFSKQTDNKPNDMQTEFKSSIRTQVDGNLKLGILPASIFCSGHTYFVQAMHEQLRLEPYAVHTTFQYAGAEGKQHRLRESMFFHDPPEYYDSSNGFLSFKPSIPKALLLDGPHTLKSHFLLMNYQLKQIRTALVVASLLNRALVMPPLWCRFDRIWFGLPGVVEGTLTRQPFLCPVDHVF